MSQALPVDYLDTDRLLTAGIDLSHALSGARAVYGKDFNPLLSAKVAYAPSWRVKALRRLAKSGYPGTRRRQERLAL